MPKGPIEYKMSLVWDASLEDLMMLAAEIEALADLVPEWQQMEAEELVNRIGERLGSWVKARKVTQ